MRTPRLVLLAMSVLLGACGGGPLVCPAGTRSADVCTGCGPAGGCASMQTRCATTCTSASQCSGSGPMGCIDGVCQITGCI